MKHTLMVAAALLLAVAPALAEDAHKVADPNGPSIELPRMKIDLGEIFERKNYDYTFVVRNRGRADLVIENVKPGCGCTLAKFDKVIAPGKEGKIELSVEGDKVHGEFTKSAQVHTNDPKHPELTITVAGSEIPFVNVVPEGTVYLHGRLEEAVEKTVTLSTNEKGLDFKVLGVTSNIDDKVKYAVTPGPAKGQYTLKIAKNAKLPAGSNYGQVFIKTNSQNAPETLLQVHVMSKGLINVSPAMLNFGPVKFGAAGGHGAPVTRTVALSSATQAFKVKDVTISNPNFTAKVEPMTDGKQYQVKVTFTPPAKKRVGQSEAGELVINTTDAREPSIRVQMIARAE